jgi:hypothetical protein
MLQQLPIQCISKIPVQSISHKLMEDHLLLLILNHLIRFQFHTAFQSWMRTSKFGYHIQISSCILKLGGHTIYTIHLST